MRNPAKSGKRHDPLSIELERVRQIFESEPNGFTGNKLQSARAKTPKRTYIAKVELGDLNREIEHEELALMWLKTAALAFCSDDAEEHASGVNRLTLASQYLAKVEAMGWNNTATATQLRKLEEADVKKIIATYLERHRNGEARGAVPALANRFGISETRVHQILKPYKAKNKIRK